jgi:hypothetical protein
MTSLDAGNDCIHWIVLWSLDHICIWIQLSSIVTKHFQNPTGSRRNRCKWLVKQALDHASDQHWDIWEPIWLRAISCFRSCEWYSYSLLFLRISPGSLLSFNWYSSIV